MIGIGLFVIGLHAGPAAAVPRPALTLEAAFAHGLQRARRPREIDHLRRRFDALRIARLRCELQITRGLAPLACYEVIAAERAWGLGVARDTSSRRRRLDADCVRAADRLRVPEGADLPPGVSGTCRARVNDARVTNRYRAGGWSED